MFQKIIVLFVNGLGVGSMPDAFNFHESYANTLAHLSEFDSNIKIPTLVQMGLPLLTYMKGQKREPHSIACFSAARSMGESNDTFSLLKEFVGLPVNNIYREIQDFSLQEELEEKFENQFLIAIHFEIKEAMFQFSKEHFETQKPILLLNNNSKAIILCHEKIKSQIELEKLSKELFDFLSSKNIAQVHVISFSGEVGAYSRNLESERIFTEVHFEDSFFSILERQKIPVTTTHGIAQQLHFKGKQKTLSPIDLEKDLQSQLDNFYQLLQTVSTGEQGRTLIVQEIFNFVENAVASENQKRFVEFLEKLDSVILSLTRSLDTNDLLIISSLSGNDISLHEHSGEITREYVPILAFSPLFQINHSNNSKEISRRASLIDIAATIAEIYQLEDFFLGKSFLPEIISTLEFPSA